MSIVNTLSKAEKLDSDLLRTFLAIARAGSFSSGADRLFKSQSAVSLQIKRLENILGQPVFERHARGIRLSAAGEKLCPVAQQVIALLDSTLGDLRDDPLKGKIRLGIPDEYGESTLPDVIAGFTRLHPQVELIVRCEDSTGFAQALKEDSLDLAVYAAEQAPGNCIILKQENIVWVSSAQHNIETREPLPVALFDRECWWRDRALKALESAGKRYRVVYSSESVNGVVAAISAGIAVGLISESSMTGNHRRLKQSDGWPNTLTSSLVLDFGAERDKPSVRAMTSAITQAFT